MILVTLLNTSTATQHVFLAGRVEAKHVEDLSEMIPLLLAPQVLHFRYGLHINYDTLITPEHITHIIIMEHTHQEWEELHQQLKELSNSHSTQNRKTKF